MNDWNALRAHYERAKPLILSHEPNEWALDPYAWDGIGAMQMTPIEQWLWSDIREVGAVFYPQWPAAGVFLDFANPAAKVAIECDGRDYHLDRAKDAARDAKLAALGWSVFRISGADCRTDFDEEARQEGRSLRFVRSIASQYRLLRGGAA